MLRIINKTDSSLSIGQYELPEKSSLDIDIPYTSNLKMMERRNIIAVVELQEIPEPDKEIPVQQEKIETSADESEEKEETVEIIPKTSRSKKSKKGNN